MAKRSKAVIRFLNRVAHFDADVELADVFKSALKNGALASADQLIEGVDHKRHPRLAARQASQHNREIAIGHLNNTLRCSFIKDIYEDFAAYLADILKGCAKNGLDPKRIIGEHKFAVEANELLALGNWNAVVSFVSDTLFRKLENEQSTLKLITAIDAKLALKLDPKTRDAALPYLELRHILVHRDGYVDAEFCKKFPHFNLKPGSVLEVKYKVVNDAKKTIVALVAHIDSKVIAAHLLDNSDVIFDPPPPVKKAIVVAPANTPTAKTDAK